MTPFESAFEAVAKLVHHFETSEDYYLSNKYQESEVRTDYIDKFWTALGWDVRHQYQTNPREQEVKVEKNPDSNASGRKADYAFYLMPEYRTPVFFCEAKKPCHNLGSPEFYFQLVRYGRAAGTPVSVLFDFEELHVVDCRYEANLQKSFPSAQIKAFHYKDYLDRDKFGDIYWLFSREAIESGKLKAFAKELPKQRGKGAAKLTTEEAKPTDEAFLTKLEEYRLTLAKAFKKADESLDAETLTEATQKVIDRLVFIRFLEDKNIESDYIVDQIAANKGGSWKSFIAWSKELDIKYNGVVFKPHEIDRPTFQALDDKVFREICRDISFSHSKYVFSYIPIELIGSIYERFLGKVVTATAKRADIEYKPEVRKAGGVYYTPKYIVDYIVENTVGKILSGEKGPLSPKEVSKLRFADIACGSGSFLIAVYDVVLHHVESWYNTHPNEARKVQCVEIDKGVFTLSLRQKQQILLDNIYGVDIDPQAVEVAQLSLFLKLLEGESGASTVQLSFEKTKILPDLSKNIVCGNSLVDYDIADLFPLTPEEEERIKPFSFETMFRDIMRNGGFDAIVGNPPWVQSKFMDASLKQALEHNYRSARKQYDLFNCFIEKSNSLMRVGGLFGYIIPSRILTGADYEPLRRFLLSEVVITEISDVGEGVFHGVTMPSMILIYRRALTSEEIATNCFLAKTKISDLTGGAFVTSEHEQSVLIEKGRALITIYEDRALASVFDKIDRSTFPLRDFVTNARGVEIGKRSELVSYEKQNGATPFLTGEDIARYVIRNQHYLKLGSVGVNYKDPSIYEGEKILIRKTGKGINATLDTVSRYVIQVIYIFKLRDKTYDHRWLLGILNSQLLTKYYFAKFGEEDKAAFPHLRQGAVLDLPIASADRSSAGYRTIVECTSQMLKTHEILNASRRDSERDQLQRKCDYLDAQIDQLVYELYGLTEDEIKIVEGR